MKCFALAAFLVVAITTMPAIEHPGIIAKGASCSSCHADKITGKSVHSAMALPCSVCHVATTEEDLTIVSLAAPKQQICFGCHLQSAKLHKPSPRDTEDCIDCHDPHSSKRRMLLRAKSDLHLAQLHR